MTANPALTAILRSLEETWSNEPERSNGVRNAGRTVVTKVMPPDGLALRLGDGSAWIVTAYRAADRMEELYEVGP